MHTVQCSSGCMESNGECLCLSDLLARGMDDQYSQNAAKNAKAAYVNEQNEDVKAASEFVQYLLSALAQK